MVPDLMGKKNLYPSLLFAGMILAIHLNSLEFIFLFGILCTMLLKYTTNYSISQKDIVIPTAVCAVVLQLNISSSTKLGLFMIGNAFSRMLLAS